MITVVFAHPAFEDLTKGLHHDTLESAAILLCQPVTDSEGDARLLVRDMFVASDADYIERTATRVLLATSFCLGAEQRAVREGLSLIYCHTHPHEGIPSFSGIDDDAELTLRSYLASRRSAGPHAALLFSKDSVIGRRLGEAEPLRVMEVGPELRFLAGHQTDEASDTHDRQIRAFGQAGQARIAALKVAIVGLGGTGSLIVQQLAHLGVRRFVLVDPDIVETSNLNRLVGAAPADAGFTAKTAVAARVIGAIQPGAEIEAMSADITSRDSARQITGADFIFNCTDTHASRHLINQLAYQYLTPVIDMGVSISVLGNGAVQFAGHSKMVGPGLPCLWCARHLNAELVRRELMTDIQRAADPYVQGGEGVVQPSVISLNGTIASLSITMFLAAIAGVPSKSRYLYYDGNRGRVSTLEAKTESGCPFCGDDAPLGWGDAIPLPTRDD